MPTERFSHLTESKKLLIREAALKEFSRVPPERVSINRIVQDAGISRGSFYTYFQGKEDLLEYIFAEFIHRIKAFCNQCLDDSGGDFWALITGLMEYLQACRTGPEMRLMQTPFGHETLIRFLEREEESDGRDGRESTIQEFYRRTNCDNLRVDGPEDFQQLFLVGLHTMLAAFVDVYTTGKEEEEAKRLFEKRLDYVRFGAARRPDQG